MTTKLEQAARQALGALVRAEALYGQPNADIQTALREALAEQEKPLYRKVLREMLDAHEQAEQEPVATIAINNWGEFKVIRVDLPEGKHDLYTRPVRTKDLTAQEKANIIYAADHRNPMAMIDAAIALYREKNK